MTIETLSNADEKVGMSRTLDMSAEGVPSAPTPVEYAKTSIHMDEIVGKICQLLGCPYPDSPTTVCMLNVLLTRMANEAYMRGQRDGDAKGYADAR